MSAAEVAARVSDLAIVRLRRAGLFLAHRPPEPKLRDVTRWLRVPNGASRDLYVKAADDVLLGRIPVFTLEPACGQAMPDWNRDPLTGTVAPVKFGQAIDVNSRQLVGDIKYLWEVNRHLELVVLAQAYELTGQARYLAGAQARLESWFDQCPYPLGPNWASGLELAIRLINWSATWQYAGGVRSPLFEGRAGELFRGHWLRIVYQHVHLIRGRYSSFSSANNHLIGEAAGVFIAGCTWPFWPKLMQWRDDAYSILNQEVEAQVAPDGVDLEQSVAYQQFVLEFLLLSLLAGRTAGIEFPHAYLTRVREMLRFLASIMDVRGNLPMIGDSDDACVLNLSHEPGFSPHRSALATGAILFRSPKLARLVGRLDDRTRCLAGDTDWEGLVAAASFPADGELKTRFPVGGYYLLGSDFGQAREIRLLVDSGPLGYLSIAAHGHADALSIYLSVAGREILIDVGTYTYHGELDWREYFRGTRAHNTVTVDGQDQSVQGGRFLWLDHADARCIHHQCDNEKGHFIGEHDGYQRLRDPVTHRREIRFEDRTFEIADLLTCRDRHAVEQWWHFSESCDVRVADGHVVATNQDASVRLIPDAVVDEIRLFRGSDDPIAGWVSRQFDVKVPTTSVRVSSRIHGTTTLRTTIECHAL